MFRLLARLSLLAGLAALAQRSAGRFRPARERCWAEIDPAALRHNVRAIRRRLGPGVGVMAVVKANAYGHGAAEVVRALAGHVEMFGVANLAEAREIRGLARGARIFILGPALPEEREGIISGGFIASLSSLEEAQAYGAIARALQTVAEAHLILDTGMGRIGVWEEEAVAIGKQIATVPGLRITGVASHLPSADEDAAYTEEQFGRFTLLVAALAKAGVRPRLRHIANSAGAARFPGEAGDLVRTGLMLYGSSPLPEFQPLVRPVLTWKTRIALVREVGAGRSISYGRTYTTPAPARIATLAVGYADGYQRHLTNSGVEVLIGGRRCPVVGRVTMDQIMVDVTQVPEVHAGDEVVLLGRQGGEEISAAELAAKAETIPWEIFTGLGRRVCRTVRR